MPLKYNPKRLPTVGVIGGFGPKSSAVFLELIFDKFAELGAAKTADFPKILFKNVQTAGVFNGKQDGFVNKNQTIKDVGLAIKGLEKMGANFITIPCNSIFGVYNQLNKFSATQIIHIANAVVKKMKQKKDKKTLLLGTTTTSFKKNNIYHGKLKQANINLVLPNLQEQKQLDKIIINVFKNQHGDKDKNYLIKLINKYRQKNKISSAILACTELPLIVKNSDIKINLFDSLKIYVDHVVYHCMRLTSK